jgi:hypothetical protein
MDEGNMDKNQLLRISAILLVGLFITTSSNAGTATFKIIATIPAIVGVNFFPDQMSAATPEATDSVQDVTFQKDQRDSEEIMLQTIVIR